jgi:hypothetical protein
MYIAVFFEVGHFPAGRFHHLERDPGSVQVPVLLPKPQELQICDCPEKAHIRSVGGATICCRYLSGERPLALQLPARVAPPPFAPLRGAPSRTLTGWALLAGMPRSAVAAVWWPAQAGHQRRTGECTRLALIRPTNRSQISELAFCSFFSSAGRAPFGAERFFVRGRGHARRK